MKQLNVFCEGQTEQGFCAQVLQPHLFPSGGGVVHTLAVGKKDHHHIYGIGRRTRYEKVRKFILNTMKQREGKNVYFTTLVDLYGLPPDFPGKMSYEARHSVTTPRALARSALRRTTRKIVGMDAAERCPTISPRWFAASTAAESVTQGRRARKTSRTTLMSRSAAIITTKWGIGLGPRR